MMISALTDNGIVDDDHHEMRSEVGNNGDDLILAITMTMVLLVLVICDHHEMGSEVGHDGDDFNDIRDDDNSEDNDFNDDDMHHEMESEVSQADG